MSAAMLAGGTGASLVGGLMQSASAKKAKEKQEMVANAAKLKIANQQMANADNLSGAFNVDADYNKYNQAYAAANKYAGAAGSNPYAQAMQMGVQNDIGFNAKEDARSRVFARLAESMRKAAHANGEESRPLHEYLRNDYQDELNDAGKQSGWMNIVSGLLQAGGNAAMSKGAGGMGTAAGK